VVQTQDLDKTGSLNGEQLLKHAGITVKEPKKKKS